MTTTRPAFSSSPDGLHLQSSDSEATPLRVKQAVWTLVLVCGVAILLAHALYFRMLMRGHCVDDAYISYRYAEHLAAGRGLVFNPGERVEGYSNLLWVLLLTGFARMGANLEIVSQVLALGCSVGALLLAVHALRQLFGVHSALLAALVVLGLAASGYYAAWSVAGLESTLFGFLLLAAWYRFVIEVREGSGALQLLAPLLALLALTRPEGVFLALGGVVLRLVLVARRGRPLRGGETLVFVAIVCGTLALYEAWRFAYYGPHLFSNSVRAKVGFGAGQLVAGLSYVARNFLWPYLPLALSGALLGRGLRRLEFATGYGLTVGYLLFVAAVGGDWSFGRLFVPILPLGLVVFAAALGASERLVALTRRAGARVACSALALGYLAYAFDLTGRQREAARWRDFGLVDSERIAIGKWLAETMPEDAVLAVYAAGQIPYYSRLYTHDMLGLNDPYIASLDVPQMGRGLAGHEKWDAAYTLERVQPDIIVEGRLVPGLHQHPLWRHEYHRMEGFWKYQELVIRRQLVERLERTGKLPRPRLH